MNFFENKDQKSSGIFLSGRQLSWLISAIIFLNFFVFIAGYFLGKKKGAEKFYQKVDQESLADQIYYSMYSLYDLNSKVASAGQDELENIETEVLSNETKVNEPVELAQSLEPLDGAIALPLAPPANEFQKDQESIEKFYAQLAGFGTLKAAELFAQKLQNHNISIKINKRESKTAKGKIIYWYQAVTLNHDSREQLQVTLDLIKKVERLKDIQVKTC